MDKSWQGSVDIAAPVERVFSYLADFPKHCEWAQTLERMDLKKAGSATGVGAVYKTSERQGLQSDRAPRGPMPEKAFKGTTECEVTELVPNKRIEWKAHPTPMGMGIHAEMSFDIEPMPNGGTHLTQSIQMHQPWLPMKLFSRFVFKMTPEEMEAKSDAQWQASLNNIKTILEQPAS